MSNPFVGQPSDGVSSWCKEPSQDAFRFRSSTPYRVSKQYKKMSKNIFRDLPLGPSRISRTPPDTPLRTRDYIKNLPPPSQNITIPLPCPSLTPPTVAIKLESSISPESGNSSSFDKTPGTGFDADQVKAWSRDRIPSIAQSLDNGLHQALMWMVAENVRLLEDLQDGDGLDASAESTIEQVKANFGNMEGFLVLMNGNRKNLN